jgi:hypothetical protein
MNRTILIFLIFLVLVPNVSAQNKIKTFGEDVKVKILENVDETITYKFLGKYSISSTYQAIKNLSYKVYYCPVFGVSLYYIMSIKIVEIKSITATVASIVKLSAIGGAILLIKSGKAKTVGKAVLILFVGGFMVVWAWINILSPLLSWMIYFIF